MEYSTNDSPKRISLPEDTGPHAMSDIEWWYYFAFLDGDKGGKYAAMTAFYHAGELPVLKGHYLIFSLINLIEYKDDSSSYLDQMLAKNMIYINLPIYMLQKPFDENIQKLYFELIQGRLPPPHRWLPHASLGKDPVCLLYGNSSMIFNHRDGQFEVITADDEIEVSLEFRTTKPVSLIGGDGKVDKLFYYSFPNNRVIGSIKKGNSTECVEGKGWFDHQWGYTAGDLLINTGWNWFGLQLEDGRELLINEFRTNKTGETFSPIANLIEQDGRLRHTANLAIQPSNYWQSPATSAFYPLEWDIAIPDFKITLNVTAAFYQQEIPVIAPLEAIWEGACTFTGNEALSTQSNNLIRGKGFMELVGYA